MTFKSSGVSNFPQWDRHYKWPCVFRNVKQPRAAEMYSCNLSVA